MSEFVAPAGWLVVRAATLLLLALLAGSLGLFWWRAPIRRVAGPLILALGLGSLGSVAVVASALGTLGGGLWLLLLLCLVFSGQRVVRWAAGSQVSWSQLHPRQAVGLAVLLLPVLLLASYPPTEFDGLTYHLPFAQSLVERGPEFLAAVRFPVFPQLQEGLFALLWPWVGAEGAQLTQLLATLATAWLLYEWGGVIAEEETPTKPIPLGLWAAALWLGNPLVLWIGSVAYVDAGLTLQVTAALYAWHRWRTTGRSVFLIASAACLGFAAATKYLGLFFVVVLTAALVLRRPGVRPLALWVGTVVALAGGWYLWIWQQTGNPLFPFYGAWFGYSAWSPELAVTAASSPPAVEAGGLWSRGWEGLVFLLLTPWRAVADRAVFHYQAPLSPWVWPMLICCLLAARRAWGRRALGLLALYALFWLTTVRDIRFLLPLLPLASLLAVLGAVQLRSSSGRFSGYRRPVVVALLLIAPGWGYTLFKLSERGPLPTSAESRASYLDRQLVGHRSLRLLLAQPHAGVDSEPARTTASPVRVYGYRLEHLRHPFGSVLVGGLLGPDRYAVLRSKARGGDRSLVRYLRDSKVTHLLVPSTETAAWFDRVRNGDCFVSESLGDLWVLTPTGCLRDASEGEEG